MSNAPNCPISRSQPTQRTPQPPGISVANIPHANDLRTAILALNALAAALRNITRGQPQVNNVYPPRDFGLAQTPFQYNRLTWNETNRTYISQNVVNPLNPQMFVTLQTIASINWTESSTGYTVMYEGQNANLLW